MNQTPFATTSHATSAAQMITASGGHSVIQNSCQDPTRRPPPQHYQHLLRYGWTGNSHYRNLPSI